MQKYEFKKLDLDNYKLTYKGIDGIEKEIPFRRNIECAKKLQGIQAKARMKMYKEMTSNGITKNDLVIQINKDDGTIIYDESNFRAYEEAYIEQEAIIVISEIFEECMKKSLDELLRDLAVDEKSMQNQKVKEEVLNFIQKFNKIISGKDEENEFPIDSE